METLTREQFAEKYGKAPKYATDTPREKPLSTRIAESLGFGKAVDVFGTEIARATAPAETRGQIEPNQPGQLAGATAQAISVPVGAAITGGGSLVGQIGAGAGAGYLYDVGSDLAEGKSITEAATPGGATLAGVLVPPAIRGVVSGIKNVISGASRLAQRIPGAISEAVPEGVKQAGTELLERIPRAVQKGQTALEESAQRAERLKSATPAVQNAIKTGLDDVVISAVEQADQPTIAAYRQMVDIAESPRTGLRPNVRPESVAGEAVQDQYKILDKARKDVGSQIGEQVDALSKTKGKVDVLPAQREMRQILLDNGIKPDISGELIFTGKFTPTERTAIQQLYNLATEAGESLTPRQVYDMDRLFSKLQREARFGDVGDVVVDVRLPDGTSGQMSLFRAFRNIYANQLDAIAPEIAPLNKQYAQLRNLQDDIESSIVKRGGFESTKDVDPAEFAQTNLRRIFSDAQSAADYRALADKLDAFSRAQGYNGANPQDLAGFAQRLRQLYPETTPETSFSGGITGGIRNAVSTALDIGAPDTKDKQAALKALLDELSQIEGT